MSGRDVCSRAADWAEISMTHLRCMTHGDTRAAALRVKDVLDALYEIGALAAQEYDRHHVKLREYF
jgi:hypothetical protein